MTDDSKPKFSDNSTFRKLWRLMRRGSLVSARIKPSIDISTEVTSFMRDFGLQRSNLQASQWFGDGSNASYDTNRFARHSEYCAMESVPEIHSALNLVADEATSRSEDGKVLFIESSNESIKSILESLFFDILDIDFYIWGWARTLCKYGDFAQYIDVHPKNGIERLITIPVNDFERIEGSKEDPQEIRFKWLTTNRLLENWQVAHFRLLGQDKFLPYGTSFIEGARSFWRKLVLMEDAMLVYRVLRAPERRVFYIDVSGVQPQNVEEFMQKIKAKLRNANVVNKLYGQVDQRFDPLDVSEDYFIPQRGDKTNRIESLPGGQHVNDIEDVEYLLKKLIAALGIPRAYLTYEEDLANKSTLASLDIRFSRTIERIQRALVSELTKIAMVHLIAHGYSGQDLLNFDLKLTNPSNLASMQKLDLLERRVQVVSGLNNEKLFDRSYILKRFFNLKNDDIQKINIGRMKDALVDGQVAFVEQKAGEQGSTGGESGGFGGGGGGGGGDSMTIGGGGEGEPEMPEEGGGPEEAELGGEPEASGEAEGELVTAAVDGFDKAKAKRKEETDYERKRRQSKSRNQSGLIDLSNDVRHDDDDTMNDPYGKKTFSRLAHGIESEMVSLNFGGKNRLLTEIIADITEAKKNDFYYKEVKEDDDREVDVSIENDDKTPSQE